jgi:hypothetical protein
MSGYCIYCILYIVSVQSLVGAEMLGGRETLWMSTTTWRMAGSVRTQGFLRPVSEMKETWQLKNWKQKIIKKIISFYMIMKVKNIYSLPANQCFDSNTFFMYNSMILSSERNRAALLQDGMWNSRTYTWCRRTTTVLDWKIFPVSEQGKYMLSPSGF